MRVVFFLLFLSGCQVADVLDGDIENQKNCCLKVTEEKIKACYAGLLELGECVDVTCGPLSDVSICRLYDGEICEGCP